MQAYERDRVYDTPVREKEKERGTGRAKKSKKHGDGTVRFTWS